MDPRQLYVDERLLGACVYCGGPPDTSDHVPSKVLLDDPLPLNLPVVEACAICNHAFSLDEEYLACFLDCVLAGSAEPAAIQREKSRRTLLHSSELANRLRLSRQVDDAGTVIWTPENDRVQNVVVKLARGHAAYELSLPQLDEPEEIMFRPLLVMSDEEKAVFENAGSSEAAGMARNRKSCVPSSLQCVPLRRSGWTVDRCPTPSIPVLRRSIGRRARPNGAGGLPGLSRPLGLSS